jgi:hypothetical protein
MRLNLNRESRQPADPNAYWRRRFCILGGGLAVLALLAWFLTGRAGPSAGAAAAAQESMAALQAGNALPTAAYGSAWPGPSPSASVTPTPRPTVKASPKPTRSAKSDAGKRSHTAAKSGARCSPADIVLSLYTSQASYPQGTQPSFQVFAVSTAAGECQLAFGPGSVHVIVKYLGQVKWDSAACAPAAAKTVLFKRGVPQVLTISWNRAATKPAGCAGSLPPGAWGTFQAVATTAGQSSPARTFKLLPKTGTAG